MRKEPIRIAHIMGKMNSGGVESFVMNFYQHIDKNKIQFDFIVDSDSTMIPKNKIEELGGRVFIVPPYSKIFSYIKSVKKILKENKYKIVHAHLNSLSIFPLYCAFCENVPIRIAHSHSTTNKKEWKKNIVKNILRKFSKFFATDYFACSEHAGKWLFGNKCFEKGKITIINNAIEIKKFEFDINTRNRIRNEFNIQDKLVLGHVGRFMEQKNHEFLINFFAELHKKNQNTILILIGEGPLEIRMREKVKKLELENSVRFLGVRNNVNELMQAMDCFVFPSLYEGLGIAVIEAQTSGLKCFVSNAVPKEVNLTGNVEFLELNNLNKWCEKIYFNENINDRKCEIQKIINGGYDISKEVIKLEKEYIERYLMNEKNKRIHKV